MEISNLTSHKFILDQVFTLHELQIYIRALKNMTSLKYEQPEDFFEHLRDSLPSQLMKYLEDYSEGNKINLQNPQEVLYLCHNLLTYLTEVQVVEVTLPIDLPYRQILRICKWWRDNSSMPIVVNIKINPELLSGLTIAFQGKFIDYSLNRWLEHEGAGIIDKLITER